MPNRNLPGAQSAPLFYIFLRGGKVLYIGTLLFSANIKDLSAALKPKSLKFEDKAVKSVEKRVTNISEHLKKPLSKIDFRRLFCEH